MKCRVCSEQCEDWLPLYTPAPQDAIFFPAPFFFLKVQWSRYSFCTFLISVKEQLPHFELKFSYLLSFQESEMAKVCAFLARSINTLLFGKSSRADSPFCLSNSKNVLA